ncbi:uncharacterized protein BO97DRAFT_126160 [Aspergillus homomorphus CBS 101889]|uniref:Uncharacterized protein n=1 Tax=Aspergillus homomorphus (strain CBS 101889) TaxID=1450537 RepID=A0A395HSH9_ASPHC|nr:hypothetical protein BO97DRAFT_126160 [Aspergillus homomorphus CBS 101889]RAL10449.1 hypothetical protein BO97DRAFT_126160 [Aspergillus homomorphus CBS 101889]
MDPDILHFPCALSSSSCSSFALPLLHGTLGCVHDFNVSFTNSSLPQILPVDLVLPRPLFLPPDLLDAVLANSVHLSSSPRTRAPALSE